MSFPKVDLLIDAYAEVFGSLSAQAADHPGFADLQHQLGLLYYLAGEPGNAVEAHERALAINPAYTAAASALGYALEGAGFPERALARWQTAAGNAPRSRGRAEHAGVRLDLAMAFGRRGESGRGLQVIESLSDEGRHRRLIARERFLLLALSGRAPEGDEVLEDLVRASPHIRTYFTDFGVFVGEAPYPQAIARLIKERESNYNLADIHIVLGLTWAAFGERAKAEQELRSALAADFDLATYHVQRGRLWTQAGEDQRAAEEFAVAIAADPDHVRARIELGSEFAALGRTREAVEQFEAAADLEPGYADIHYQLGLLQAEAGRLDEAEQALTRALEINPDFAFARASLALLCSRRGHDRDALTHYQRALRSGLRSADIYLSIALIHGRRGDLVRAAEALRRGEKVNPRYAPIHYHLGRIYQQRGQKGRALAAWRRFFECADAPEFAERIERFRAELGREAMLKVGAGGGIDVDEDGDRDGVGTP